MRARIALMGMLLLLAALAACAQATAAPIPSTSAPGLPTGTPSPAHVQSYVQETQRIATLRVLGQERATQSMATVIAMRELPTLTMIPAPTGRPTRTLSPAEATSGAAYNTQIAPFSGCGIDTELISPNGEWMFCSPNVGVMSRDGQPLSIDTGSLKFEVFNPAAPIYWTLDGSFVYFTTRPSVDGCGFSYDYFDGLYRLGLKTGKVSAVLPPLSIGDGFYDISVSPTGRRIAYVQYWSGKKPLVAKVQDIRSGEFQSIELDSEFDDAGGFVWSPDGTKLIVQMQRRKEDPDTFRCPVAKTAIIIADTLEKTHEVLFGDYPGYLKVKSWSEDNVLTYYTEQDNLVRTYDLNSQAYGVVGTATPYP